MELVLLIVIGDPLRIVILNRLLDHHSFVRSNDSMSVLKEIGTFARAFHLLIYPVGPADYENNFLIRLVDELAKFFSKGQESKPFPL